MHLFYLINSRIGGSNYGLFFITIFKNAYSFGLIECLLGLVQAWKKEMGERECWQHTYFSDVGIICFKIEHVKDNTGRKYKVALGRREVKER